MTEEPKEHCQYCQHWEQEVCVNPESDWWNHRRGAGCTCEVFAARPARKKQLATANKS